MWTKIKDFFKGVINEMRRVSWTSRKELFGATAAVLVLSTLMVLFVWGIDSIFKTLLALILKAVS